MHHLICNFSPPQFPCKGVLGQCSYFCQKLFILNLCYFDAKQVAVVPGSLFNLPWLLCRSLLSSLVKLIRGQISLGEVHARAETQQGAMSTILALNMFKRVEMHIHLLHHGLNLTHCKSCLLCFSVEPRASSRSSTGPRWSVDPYISFWGSLVVKALNCDVRSLFSCWRTSRLPRWLCTSVLQFPIKK